MDTGQINLENDIEILLIDVRDKRFHDFDSHMPAPKMYLVRRLQEIIDNTKNGKYDN